MIAAASAKMCMNVTVLVCSVPKSFLVMETGKIALHGVRVFAIRVILGLNFRHLELQATRVQIESCTITPAHVQRNVFCTEAFHHRSGGLVHQLLRDPQSSMRAFHSQTGNVSMRIILAIFFHLGEHVAHYSPLLVLRYVAQLWPRESVIEIILHLIIFRQALQITVLYVQQVLRSRTTYVYRHLEWICLSRDT
ncbi:hypothetical protein X777_13370 [Ooceraea biroi]|uniref:Uncharacterized protein n=1 Tax=Ooceraea biroi TaxID=2015173 RepID=A0A026WX19_OOCBI|nr:hypothetical protein X777_13370 [Ooceraea biroi]